MLGRTAVDGQHTDEPVPPGRKDNLWEPVAGDHGAHGRFDVEAVGFSAQAWADRHRGAIAVGALVGALVGWGLGRR